MLELNIGVNASEEERKSWRDYVMGLDEYKSNEELASVPLFPDYPDFLLNFATTCCVLFMLIGIPGNLLTIIALARCKKVRNATAIFIINLSVSDFLFCCFNLPLAASSFVKKSWPHGILLCRLFPLARYGLVATSLFTVLAITINRYILISHPALYPKIYKNRYLYLIIAFVWLISFGALVPTYIETWGRFSLNPITGSCTIVPDKHEESPKKFLFGIAFGLPSIAIILCYARILWIVRKTIKNAHIPVRLTPINQINFTTEVPETAISISNPPAKKESIISRSRRIVPCFLTPELSSSCNDKSSNDDLDRYCAPEYKPGRYNSDHAKRIRQSFIATFRKSTMHIKPRMPTKRDKRLLAMIVAIITSFCICHLPITLTKTIVAEYSTHPYMNIFGYLLIYMTPCINPILYVVMSVEYRQAYKNCLDCK